jgi:hypothetical protein
MIDQSEAHMRLSLLAPIALCVAVGLAQDTGRAAGRLSGDGASRNGVDFARAVPSDVVEGCVSGMELTACGSPGSTGAQSTDPTQQAPAAVKRRRRRNVSRIDGKLHCDRAQLAGDGMLGADRQVLRQRGAVGDSSRGINLTLPAAEAARLSIAPAPCRVRACRSVSRRHARDRGCGL